MDFFRTGCPVTRQTEEAFVQWLIVGGDRQRMVFTKTILWIQESESRIVFKHGGRMLHEHDCHNDFYGYMTSCDEASLSPRQIAFHFGITPDSSLELVVLTSIFLAPAIETIETKSRNASQPINYKPEYASVPTDWCREIVADGQTLSPSLHRQMLTTGITWSSKHSTEENALLLSSFKATWRVQD